MNEHLHTKTCLASALISAIENLRDSEYYDDYTFRLVIQNNEPLQEADQYLEWADSQGAQICLKECGATNFNRLWHEARNNVNEFGTNTEWENEFMDRARRTLDGTNPDHQYSYQKFFTWLYDFIASEQHNEELDAEEVDNEISWHGSATRLDGSVPE